MTPKCAEEIQGLEYDWLASDADGNIALFSTAGGGCAPAEFLRNMDLHDAAIEAILSAPARTEALFAPEVPDDRQNTWKLMAERGVFAFDSDSFGGPYRLVSAPKEPARSHELPERAIQAVDGIRLVNLRFSEMTEVSAECLIRSGI